MEAYILAVAAWRDSCKLRQTPWGVEGPRGHETLGFSSDWYRTRGHQFLWKDSNVRTSAECVMQ